MPLPFLIGLLIGVLAIIMGWGVSHQSNPPPRRPNISRPAPRTVPRAVVPVARVGTPREVRRG